MSRTHIFATLEGPAFLDGLRRAARLDRYAGLPERTLIGGERNTAPGAGWLESIAGASGHAHAYWGDGNQLGIVAKSEQLAIVLPRYGESIGHCIALLEPLPFEVCCIGAAFFDEWIAADYARWGFGRSHIDNGWGCAFRGAGHDQLVSRRWLDFGPWRVIRRPNDTTFVQFHDLALTDPAEAYEQAKPGLQRMGNDPTGGHIGFYKQKMIASAGKGLYTERQNLLEVVVGPGNEVTQGQMLCNCALRLHHKQTRPTTGRIDRIAYVFVDEGDARRHLHELWLRELECWVVDDRGKRRLDADYRPVPTPPAWVTRLNAAGG